MQTIWWSERHLSARIVGYYLCGRFDGGAIFQEEFHHLDSVLLASDVQGCEAVLKITKKTISESSKIFVDRTSSQPHCHRNAHRTIVCDHVTETQYWLIVVNNLPNALWPTSFSHRHVKYDRYNNYYNQCNTQCWLAHYWLRVSQWHNGKVTQLPRYNSSFVCVRCIARLTWTHTRMITTGM